MPRHDPGAGIPMARKKCQSLVQADRTPSRVDSVPGPFQSVAVLAIDPTYFRNPVDLDIMVSTGKNYLESGMTGQLVSTIVGEVSPGTEVQTNQQRAETAHFNVHPLGSAPMLPREDDGAVDANLIVYRTKTLKVVN